MKEKKPCYVYVPDNKCLPRVEGQYLVAKGFQVQSAVPSRLLDHSRHERYDDIAGRSTGLDKTNLNTSTTLSESADTAGQFESVWIHKTERFNGIRFAVHDFRDPQSTLLMGPISTNGFFQGSFL